MSFLTGKYVWTAILLSLLAATIGCTKAPNDAQVTELIHSKLNQDSGLQGKSINIATSNGVVTLSGTVDNDRQREAAARYASTIPGIREVVNNLQITSVANTPATQTVAENIPPVSTSSSAQAAPAPVPQTSRERSRNKSSRPSSPTSQEVSDAGNNNAVDVAQGTPPPNDATDNPTPSDDAVSPKPASAPPTPAPRMLTVQSGTVIAVRLIDPVDSETAKVGQTFKATLDAPISSEWEIAIPAGYNVEGHVVNVKSAGKFAGQPELVLQLDRILVGEKSYDIETDQFRRVGKNRTTNTAEKVGAGAVLGAIIGGIAGGGKGAGIGAAAGGGVGGGVQAASKPQPVKLASETVLNFTLQSPLTVTQVNQGPETERRKLVPSN
jgi:BON domain